MDSSPISKGKAMIPSMFTLANLFFGFLAIIWTMDANYFNAAALIIFSVLMDGMDGKVARKLSASSEFGKELDSLSDLVSFGVAPALLIYKAFLEVPLGTWGMVLAAVFALCGAVRLARFNVMNITTHFVGVPITVAGGVLALLVLLQRFLPWLVFPLALGLLAYLMVSTFKVPKI